MNMEKGWKEGWVLHYENNLSLTCREIADVDEYGDDIDEIVGELIFQRSWVIHEHSHGKKNRS